jgi:hypothetical protein
MNTLLIDLINVAFTSEQAHEYYINKDGNLEGFGHEVIIYGTSYIVKGSDCSRCDGSHVDCHYVERVSEDAEEALENLEIMKGVTA